MLCHAKQRTREQHLPDCTITEADIVIPSRCPVFGFPLKVARGQRADNSPSLDRVVPKLGYVPGNVIVVSWLANRIKSNATVDELQQVAAFYTQLTKGKK
jgi:hypothetical protein